MRWIDTVKDAMTFHLQKKRMDVNARTFWRSLSHNVTIKLEATWWHFMHTKRNTGKGDVMSIYLSEIFQRIHEIFNKELSIYVIFLTTTLTHQEFCQEFLIMCLQMELFRAASLLQSVVSYFSYLLSSLCYLHLYVTMANVFFLTKDWLWCVTIQHPIFFCEHTSVLHFMPDHLYLITFFCTWWFSVWN